MKISDDFTIDCGNNIIKVDTNGKYATAKEVYNYLRDEWTGEDRQKIIDNRDNIIDSILDEEEK